MSALWRHWGAAGQRLPLLRAIAGLDWSWRFNLLYMLMREAGHKRLSGPPALQKAEKALVSSIMRSPLLP